jgi:hypothetical protein
VKEGRAARAVSEREIALALVLQLAQDQTGHGRTGKFSLQQFYDDDIEFVHDLGDTLGVKCDRAFDNKLRKVTQMLVRYGVLESRMSGTQKDYFGEPAKQRDYWLPPGKALLLTKGQTACTMTPEGEASFLLRRAYPKPDDDPA